MLDDHFRSMIMALEQNGLSRAQIAQDTGISLVTVWRLAQGITIAPTAKTIRKLSDLHERRCTVIISRREMAVQR